MKIASSMKEYPLTRTICKVSSRSTIFRFCPLDSWMKTISIFTTKVKKCGKIVLIFAMIWKTNLDTNLRKVICSKDFRWRQMLWPALALWQTWCQPNTSETKFPRHLSCFMLWRRPTHTGKPRQRQSLTSASSINASGLVKCYPPSISWSHSIHCTWNRPIRRTLSWTSISQSITKVNQYIIEARYSLWFSRPWHKDASHLAHQKSSGISKGTRRWVWKI